ncbi:MAG: hypothetical protein HGA65_01710, partial [Oscillochloris sp.]|nr:hypothetical protein [Oscillochloris sp.]
MLKGILTTKLHQPAQGAGYVVRPHLCDRLNQSFCLARPLTLLSAPAGAGKSALLAAWLMDKRQAADGRHRESPDRLPPAAAWLTLDDHDNDPVRFWTYVIAALQTIRPGLGQPMLQALQLPQPPPLPLLLTALLGELADLAEPLALVLDDYHLIATPAIHESLAVLLDQALPGLQLIIAAHRDPPLPLARLRTQNRLVELRADDLRFTSAEATTFFHQAMGLPLQPDEVELLLGRTEGWPAGLHLVALALHGRAAPRTLIEDLRRTPDYPLDYLLEAVLQCLPPAIRYALTATAILDRFCPELCAAVLRDEARTVKGEVFISHLPFDRLERTNPFLTALDSEQHWYRYHQLFRDLLRVRLDHTYPEAIPELHRRAAAWFAAQELPAEAIHHAFAAADTQHAADLIEQYIPARWALGDATLLSLIARLPIDLVQARPRLAIHHAFALVVFGLHLSAEEVLRGMLARLPAQVSGEVRAIADVA